MIIIAEKINASIPSVKRIIEERHAEKLITLAGEQAKAGADYIDVNVGTGSGTQDDEIAAMQWAVETIQKELDTPLCIDSADPEVLEAGLAAVSGDRALINSTKGSEKYLHAVVPLAKKYNFPLIGLAMDEEGIPKTVAERVAACGKITDACRESGITEENLFFDPLVLPVSTDVKQGMVTLNTISAIKKKFPTAGTVMAVSNVSFGLPKRKKFNAAFLQMAIYAGLDAAILNVRDQELVGAIRTANAIMGRDRHCRKYSRFWRTAADN